MKLEVAASSHSTNQSICKIVLGLLLGTLDGQSEQSVSFTLFPRPIIPTTHSSVLLETDTPTDRETDRQTSFLHPSVFPAREQRQHTHRPQQTQGWEQRHRAVGQHTAGPARAPRGTSGSITTAAAPLTLMHSELGYRCDVGTLLDISFKFHPPESAAWRKDPAPFKSQVRGYAAFPAAHNDYS